MVDGCSRNICYNKDCAKYSSNIKMTKESAIKIIMEKIKKNRKI